MGSTYDRQQTESLSQILEENKKESKKTTAILIISVLALLVAILGVAVR